MDQSGILQSLILILEQLMSILGHLERLQLLWEQLLLPKNLQPVININSEDYQ
jgi:hypothetical protein